MFKASLLLFAVMAFAIQLTSAQVDPNSGLDIPWNTALPINADTIGNATKAAAQNRYFLANGSIGDVIPSNITLNATVANATASNITNPLGCKLRVPKGFQVDPFVGEYCYFTGNAGFMFRGVRDSTGKLFLQRYRLKTHKSSLISNMTNSTANASMITNATNITIAPVVAAPAPAPIVLPKPTIGAFLELDAEETEELETEEELEENEEEADPVFAEIESLLEAQPSAHLSKLLRASFIERNAPAVVESALPPLPTVSFGKCAQKAAEFLDCTGGALVDVMNGTEAKGFCVDDQTSATIAMDLRDFTSRFSRFRKQIKSFSDSIFNVADSKSDPTRFNKEEDHVKFCFLPGTYVEKYRYKVRGQYQSFPLGDAYGFFKPTLDVACYSKYCVAKKVLPPKGPKNIFLNLSP